MLEGIAKAVHAISRSRSYFGTACITVIAVVALVLYSDLEGKTKAAFMGMIIGSFILGIAQSALRADEARDTDKRLRKIERLQSKDLE